MAQEFGKLQSYGLYFKSNMVPQKYTIRYIEKVPCQLGQRYIVYRAVGSASQ